MNPHTGVVHDGGFTVTDTAPDILPEVAVIVAFPADTPVTTPFNTVAIDVLELVHVIVPHDIAVLNWSKHVDVRVQVPPIAIADAHPLTDKDVTTGFATIIEQDPVDGSLHGMGVAQLSVTRNATVCVPAIENNCVNMLDVAVE